MSICSIAGCERTIFARGFCTRHYRAWRENGDALIVKQQQFHGVSPWSDSWHA